MGLADQCSGVLVRVGSRKQKVPGSSLIIGGDFSFLLIFDLFVFNSNDSENFLSVAKMLSTVHERETCLVAVILCALVWPGLRPELATPKTS